MATLPARKGRIVNERRIASRQDLAVGVIDVVPLACGAGMRGIPVLDYEVRVSIWRACTGKAHGIVILKTVRER